MTMFGALFLKNQEKQRCLMRLFLKKSRCYSNPIILIYIYIYISTIYPKVATRQKLQFGSLC